MIANPRLLASNFAKRASKREIPEGKTLPLLCQHMENESKPFVRKIANQLFHPQNLANHQVRRLGFVCRLLVIDAADLCEERNFTVSSSKRSLMGTRFYSW